MRVLICPDKFKGSLDAGAVARAIERGVRRALPEAETILQPLADGGEGSLDILSERGGFRTCRLTVPGPLRKPIDAEYLMGDGEALIESAAACGLHLVPPARRHPKNTTTIGVGMLIEDALARGARRIKLFLGGSATNDGGTGMAAALSYRFLGPNGEDFIPMADSLGWVARIDPEKIMPELEAADITAVYDVDNPLLGPSGATYTYAKQKGAAAGDLDDLERQMSHLADRIKSDLGNDVRDLPGGGAAGGLGAGAVAFLGAGLHRGTDVLFEAVDFDRLAGEADLVITGEGKIDAQTAHSKVVAGVVARGRPTVAVCGRADVSAAALGLESILSITQTAGIGEATAIREAAEHIERLVADYLRHRTSDAI